MRPVTLVITAEQFPAVCHPGHMTAEWSVAKKGGKDSLGLGLGVGDLADVDGVFRVADVAHLVHVGSGDGDQAAVAVEGQRRDAGRIAVELAQALLVERVPNVNKAVRAAWKERTGED